MSAYAPRPVTSVSVRTPTYLRSLMIGGAATASRSCTAVGESRVSALSSGMDTALFMIRTAELLRYSSFPVST